MNYILLLMTMIIGLFLLLLPRRYAYVPVIVAACYIPLEQKIVIENLNFVVLRILMVFGWIRLILRKELLSIDLNVIDYVFIVWVVIRFAAYFLLRETSEAFINRCGMMFDAFGIYFFFRALIENDEDVMKMIRALAIIIIPLSAIVTIEFLTGRNLFSIFGGVPEYSSMRNYGVRSQGPFISPITLGCVGAILMPLMVSLFLRNSDRKILAIGGFVAATIITVASTSSGPVMAYAFGIIGLAMWPLRNHMREIRWAAISGIVLIHILMEAPVWHLLARVSGVTGGHGWYRAHVIDQAFQHIGEWWLLGTQDTWHWGLNALSYQGKSDITNYYIGQGIEAGFLAMLLLILMIALCFKSIGTLLKLKEHEPIYMRFAIWSIGVVLFVHVINFFNVAYFDQIIVFWYSLLAIISVIHKQQCELLVEEKG